MAENKPTKYIDRVVIAEGALPPVTYDDAAASLAVAELPATINLKRFRARKTVGQFLGHDVHGSLMVETVLTNEQQAVMEAQLMKIISTPQIKMASKLRAMRQLDAIHQTRIKVAEIQLQIGEVEANRSKIGTKLSNAPDIQGSAHHHGPHIDADTVHIHVQEIQPKIEQAPAKT